MYEREWELYRENKNKIRKKKKNLKSYSRCIIYFGMKSEKEK